MTMSASVTASSSMLTMTSPPTWMMWLPTCTRRAAAHAGLFGRAARNHFQHQGPVFHRQLQGFGHPRSQRHEGDSGPGVQVFALLDQVLHHPLGRIHRDGKPDADAGPRGAEDGAGDADQVAGGIDGAAPRNCPD